MLFLGTLTLLLITSFLVWKTKHVGATVNIVMLDTGLTKMGPENLKQVTTYPASMSATVKHYCASTMWHFPILENKHSLESQNFFFCPTSIFMLQRICVYILI